MAAAGYAYLDLNTPKFAWQANGLAGLNRLASIAERQGYSIAVTDAVQNEINNSTSIGQDISNWLDSRRAATKSTAEFAALQDYVAGNNPEYGVKYGGNPAGSAGDRSILERIVTDRNSGVTSIGISDDGFFDRTQNYRGFSTDKSSIIKTAELMVVGRESGSLAPDDFVAARDAYRTKVSEFGLGSGIGLDQFDTPSRGNHGGAVPQPLGVVFWGFVMPKACFEVEGRLKAGNAKLRPQDWRSGDRLWVIDVLAPFGAGDEMVKDLKLKLFPDRPLNLLTVDAGRLTAKVV